MLYSPLECEIDGIGIPELTDALASHTSEFGSCHPQTIAIANLLAGALWAAGDVDEAVGLLGEVLARYTQLAGPHHPLSIVAKSDLSAVLFELGHEHEAVNLETEAFQSARAHLGRTHPVSTVLTWNRALRFEESGNGTGARRLFSDELAWLLTEEDGTLAAEQTAIRTMLAQRLNWESAPVC